MDPRKKEEWLNWIFAWDPYGISPSFRQEVRDLVEEEKGTPSPSPSLPSPSSPSPSPAGRRVFLWGFLLLLLGGGVGTFLFFFMKKGFFLTREEGSSARPTPVVEEYYVKMGPLSFLPEITPPSRGRIVTEETVVEKRGFILFVRVPLPLEKAEEIQREWGSRGIPSLTEPVDEGSVLLKTEWIGDPALLSIVRESSSRKGLPLGEKEETRSFPSYRVQVGPFPDRESVRRFLSLLPGTIPRDTIFVETRQRGM